MNTQKFSENHLVKRILYLFLILLVTFIIYAPARNAKFTNWDDAEYVTKNPDITSFKKYKSQLLTKEYAGNYHPLTMLSLAYDYSVGKLNPKIYHRTSILIHLVNAALVFWLIILLTGNLEIGLICGILFGVHPLHVESVAWISERKNVLYALFFLASLIAYIKYLKEEKTKFYFIALFLFILSLLSKGVAVSLTITLFAIDYLFERKLLSKKVLFEKIPFLTLSIFFGILAIHFQPITADEVDPMRTAHLSSSFFEKILYATYNVGQYIAKLFIPFKLAVFYPYPLRDNGALPLEYYIIPFLIIAFLTIAFIFLIKRKGYYSKFILFCFLFFIINIALVLQLLPVGDAIMADRYAYIPSIGFFLFIGVTYKYIAEHKPQIRNAFILVLTLYCLGLSYFTSDRCKVWHDSISLWTDQIEKYPKLGFPYNNRGIAKHDLEDLDGALEDYNKCIKFDPSFYKAYYNKGMLESKRGNLEASLNNFNKAISINKNYVELYPERGSVKYKLKDYKGSVEDYSFYINLNPSSPLVYNARGLSFFFLDEYSKAVADYNKAIELQPDYAEAYCNRGMTKSILKDFQGAMFDFNKAIEINPSYSHAYYNRGKLQLYAGLGANACADLQKAAQYGLAQAANEFNQYCK